eukprot:gb/GECG01002911.1/.p1 GENE.gb/GECG01002911.1/~~gb/GECG01002911.1/.p1  ORF type:complete len:1327 (+),score=183.78 gb/GECG01002911.1/:1-3981(+)
MDRNQAFTVVLAASAAGVVATVATYLLMRKTGVDGTGTARKNDRGRKDDEETEKNESPRPDSELTTDELLMRRQQEIDEQRLKLDQDQMQLIRTQKQMADGSRGSTPRVPDSSKGYIGDETSYGSYVSQHSASHTASPAHVSNASRHYNPQVSRTPPGTWRTPSQHLSPHYSPQVEPGMGGGMHPPQFSLDESPPLSITYGHGTPGSDSYVGTHANNSRHYGRPGNSSSCPTEPVILKQAYGEAARPPLHPSRYNSQGGAPGHQEWGPPSGEQGQHYGGVSSGQHGIPPSYLRPPEYSESSESSTPFVNRQITGQADNEDVVYEHEKNSSSQHQNRYSYQGTPSELSSEHHSIEVSPQLQPLSDAGGTGIPLSLDACQTRDTHINSYDTPAQYQGDYTASSYYDLRADGAYSSVRNRRGSGKSQQNTNRNGYLASSGRSYSHSPQVNRFEEQQNTSHKEHNVEERTASYESERSLTTSRLEAEELKGDGASTSQPLSASEHNKSEAGGSEDSDMKLSDVRPSGMTPLRIKRPTHRQGTGDSTGTDILDSGRSDGNAKIKKTPFHDDYELGDVIGRGTFSVVRTCTHRENGEQRAVKCIDTKRFRLSQNWKQSRLLDEVQVLSKLGQHLNIIHLFDVYSHQSDHYVYIVTEYAKGGELFDSLVSAGNFSEDQARNVMKQALQALQFMHQENIIHRDLKPENILVMNSKDEANRSDENGDVALRVKIADFGVARYIGNTAGGASTFCGSPQYVAPEVLFARQMPSKYGKPVDVWSLGVILYAMLAGYLPFDEYPEDEGDENDQVAQMSWEERIKTGTFHFPPPVWTHISSDAKQLITGMLQVDPEKRLSVDQCLKHPWFASERSSPLKSDTAEGQTSSNSVSLTQTSVSATGTPDSQIDHADTGRFSNGSALDTPGMTMTNVKYKSDGEADALTSVGGLKGNCSDEIRLTVKRSLDLDSLIDLLRSTGKHFEAAYRSVQGLPQASEVIRRHALTCKQLENRIKHALTRFKHSADNILGVLDDLQLAVQNKDTNVAHELFGKLKDWLVTLKDEAISIRTEYQQTIWSVQSSLQRARIITDRAGRQALEHCGDTIEDDHKEVRNEHGEHGAPEEEESQHLPFDGEETTKEDDNSLAIVPSRQRHAEALRDLVRTALGPQHDCRNCNDLSACALLEVFLNTPFVAHDPEDVTRLFQRCYGLEEGTEDCKQTSDQPDHRPRAGMTELWRPSMPVQDQGERLQNALEELQSVDDLLSNCVDFWSSMELIVDVVVQRKEHSEVLLKHATTEPMIERAMERMSSYRGFWECFRSLCEKYADTLETNPTDYSFING